MQKRTLRISEGEMPQKILYTLFWVFFVLSGIQPFGFAIWFFQGLVPAGMAILLFLVRRHYFPSLPTALLLFVQGLMLLLGAHYSFHRIPLLRVTFPDGLNRSVMDWVVHFVDGLVYAAILKELRLIPGRLSNWLTRTKQHFPATVLLLCTSLALSWELVEWLALVASGDIFHIYGGIMADTFIDITLTVLGGLVFLLVTALCRIRIPSKQGKTFP